MTSAVELIERLGLQPHPSEGGHYRETWRADESVDPAALPERYSGERTFGTAILYLLTSDPNSFSALHRLPTDEIFHFYLGDPVELLHAAEIRDRLPVGPARDQALVGGLGVGSDRGIAVGDDGRAVDADGVREQELGVEPGRVGRAGGAEALGTGLHERAGRGHRASVRVGS